MEQDYYRKYTVYDLQWNIDLQLHIVCPAPYAGPIAVVKDQTAPSLLKKDTPSKIYIFSAAGNIISSALVSSVQYEYTVLILYSGTIK